MAIDDAKPEVPIARVVVLRTGQPLSRVHAHCGPFYRLFMRFMNEGEADPRRRVAVDELDVTCRREGDPLPSLARYDAAIMTGSPAYVGDDEPWMRWGQRLIRHMVEIDLPFLGVCFGHQMVGRAFGATVGPNPRGREMGTVDVSITDHQAVIDDPLWSTAPRSFQAQVTHRDVILDPGPHLRVLGRADHDDFHIVKAGPRQWGVQFHPEFDDVTMRLYLETRRSAFDAERGPGASDARIAKVTTTAQSARLLRRFAGLALDNALQERRRDR
jgi:GMP synthase (glutamine-hydrolysing)